MTTNNEYYSGILTMIVLISFVTIYYAGDKIPDRVLTGVSYYEQPSHHSCHVIVTEPSIVVRIDDITDNSEPSKEMILELLRRNISMTLGVIPDRISEQHKYNEFLKLTARNSIVEIAVHGKNHSTNDINISEENLALGFEKVVSDLGVVPVTYIPPFNAMTAEAKARASSRYRVVSLTGGTFRSGDTAAEVSQDVETFDYEREFATKTGPSDINTIVSKCTAAISTKNLCVVTFHPQELSTDIENAYDVNTSKFMQYQIILDNLQKMNATFITLKDTTRCI